MSESVMEIDKSGHKVWRNLEGQYHRTDGPAIEFLDGTKYWYVNGKLHRLDGPAVEYSDGDKWWYVNDECLAWNDEGFWTLWDTLTPVQKQDPVLLSYLPGGLNV